MEVTQLSTAEQRVIHTMQLLGDTTRFKMFKLMSSKKDLCVSEIAQELNISASAVSQHFRTFELLGLVSKERTGQRICYTLTDDTLVQELKQLTRI
jgi:predicted transcriptional regulator